MQRSLGDMHKVLLALAIQERKSAGYQLLRTLRQLFFLESSNLYL